MARRRPDLLPNTRLSAARERLRSPSGSGRPMSRQELAEAVNAYLWDTYHQHENLDENDIGKLERGEHRWPGARRREAFRAVLKAAFDAELGFYIIRHGNVRSYSHVTLSQPGNGPDIEQVELLREELNDALCEGTMAEAGLDDWELTVLRYGRATRDHPADVLLRNLTTDLAELRRAIHRHRSASALRRLTRVAAQMCGLMCLTLCKLDDRPAFRRWARTARLAADESGDPQTRSWVLAQEAYGHYYSADLLEAVDVAQRAQAVRATTPGVGAALAAALEARAYAAMRRDRHTRAALGHAEGILSRLDSDALTPSAFGYNEAQLRFHEGNAYTNLGNARAAFTAQDRALELCAPGDFTDWAMIRLDRARCLAAVGETGDALGYATETLTALSESQRRGIITLRGHEMLSALPKDQRALPAARVVHELLMLTTELKEVRDP